MLKKVEGVVIIHVNGPPNVIIVSSSSLICGKKRQKVVIVEVNNNTSLVFRSCYASIELLELITKASQQRVLLIGVFT